MVRGVIDEDFGLKMEFMIGNDLGPLKRRIPIADELSPEEIAQIVSVE